MNYLLLLILVWSIFFIFFNAVAYLISKIMYSHKESQILNECIVRNGKNILHEEPFETINYDSNTYDKELIIRRLKSDYRLFDINDLKFELDFVIKAKKHTSLNALRLQTLKSMIKDYDYTSKDSKHTILRRLLPNFYATELCMCAFALQLIPQGGALIVIISFFFATCITKLIFKKISNAKIAKCRFLEPCIIEAESNKTEPVKVNLQKDVECTYKITESQPAPSLAVNNSVSAELSTEKQLDKSIETLTIEQPYEVSTFKRSNKRRVNITGTVACVVVLLITVLLCVISFSSGSIKYDSTWKNVDTFAVNMKAIEVPANDYSYITITSYENFETAYDSYYINYYCDDSDNLVDLSLGDWYLNDNNNYEINLTITPLSQGNTTISIFYTSDDGKILGNIQEVSVDITSSIEHYASFTEIPDFSAVSSSKLISSGSSDGQTYYTYDSQDVDEVVKYEHLLDNCGFTYYGEVNIDDNHSLHAYWRNGYIVYIGALKDGINITIGEYN